MREYVPNFKAATFFFSFLPCLFLSSDTTLEVKDEFNQNARPSN